MPERSEDYLQKAIEFEAKAAKAENENLRATYELLARNYRSLAEYVSLKDPKE